MWSNVIRYKDSYFSISIYSTPIIFVCGFLLITSISRFFIFLVFQRNPKNRLYCTVAATKMLSRFTNVPVNSPSGVVHPFNENHGSEISTHFRTIVVVSPGKYTMLSRTVPRNLVIVSICAVVTASNSRFFVCNVFINYASIAPVAVPFVRQFFNFRSLHPYCCNGGNYHRNCRPNQILFHTIFFIASKCTFAILSFPSSLIIKRQSFSLSKKKFSDNTAGQTVCFRI